MGDGAVMKGFCLEGVWAVGLGQDDHHCLDGGKCHDPKSPGESGAERLSKKISSLNALCLSFSQANDSLDLLRHPALDDFYARLLTDWERRSSHALWALIHRKTLRLWIIKRLTNACDAPGASISSCQAVCA
jgi:hypothetical protein